MIYRHSGSLGDIIYSLPVIKKLGKGELHIPLDNLKSVCKKYGYNTSIMHSEHTGCMTQNSVDLLRPLLESQSYIDLVTVRPADSPVDVDLDKFRGVLFRSFNGNYVEAYMKTFALPFTDEDAKEPWLDVESFPQEPFVVCRTPRYITNEPYASKVWHDISIQNNFENLAIFVGTTKEHEDFQRNTKTKIRYYPVRDFLQLAQLIKGCARFFGNQTFAYSLAMALGRPATLEYQKNKPLALNECYFEKRNVNYI